MNKLILIATLIATLSACDDHSQVKFECGDSMQTVIYANPVKIPTGYLFLEDEKRVVIAPYKDEWVIRAGKSTLTICWPI